MAFQRSAVHLKSLYAEENEQTSEVAERELTHLEISLKIALHGPAVFYVFASSSLWNAKQNSQRLSVQFIGFLQGWQRRSASRRTQTACFYTHSSLH